MAAPLGNQFWKLRSKHGRDKLFESPELMWEAACEYFQWCEDNPLIEIDYTGKDATKVEKPKMRAFTIQGLTLYLGCNVQYFNDFEKGLKDKSNHVANDFSSVVTRIRETIYNQKFTGAAAGFLKENIISRELGLADKTNTELSGSVNTTGVDISKLSDEALKELRDAQSTKP